MPAPRLLVNVYCVRRSACMSYSGQAATGLPKEISESGEMSLMNGTLDHVREVECAAIIARCESTVCLGFAAAGGEPTAQPAAHHVPCRMDLQKNGQNRNDDR